METLLAAMLLVIPKRPAAVISWQTDGNRNFRFDVELVGETDDLRLRLFGRASAGLPGGNVSLGLLFESNAVWRAFERLDWRPSRPHNNRALGPPEWRFVLIHGSHHHAGADNGELAMGFAAAIEAGLPVAVPLPNQLAWRELLQHASLIWNVGDLADIQLPPW